MINLHVTADDLMMALEAISNGEVVEWEDDNGNTVTLTPVEF